MHENTVDYILGELSKQRKTNENVSKCLAVQDKQNRTTAALAIICVAFGYLGAKKIKELEKEIKELKKLKGD